MTSWIVLQLADSAFPSGGFAHSAGIEALAHTGELGRLEPFCAELVDQLVHGSLPIVGVNTFRNPDGDSVPETLELARSDDAEKQEQLRRLGDFQSRHAQERDRALERLRDAATGGGNVFAVLMEAVRCCSLGQITDALFDVGGRYRRNV